MPPSERPPSSAPEAGVRVSVMARGDDLFEVTFHGPFRLGWLARLSGALSRRRISIVRALAERAPHGDWHAQLELLAGAGTPDLLHLPLRALCDEDAPASQDPNLPHLSSFRLERGEGNLLELVVAARDEVGFLSSLFARLGFLGLFPERIVATTRGGRIDDSLTLRGIGGEPPSAVTEQALRAALTRLCQPSVPVKPSGSSPPGSKSTSG